MEVFFQYISWLLVALGIVVSILAALHALLNHRKPQSTFTWVAVCLMWPLVGAALYYVFGKNRVATRAKLLHGGSYVPAIEPFTADTIDKRYESLGRLSQNVTGKPLLPGNAITPLFDGVEAYPAMLAAIASAETSVYLVSYIFDYKGVGKEFVQRLGEAHARGVEVKVLVDGVGEKYSLPTARSQLQKLGVEVTQYLPPKLLPPKLTINLRNHRKLLIIDDRLAFTGGMNIRASYLPATDNCSAVKDIHFALKGPIVGQMLSVFRADWNFSEGANFTQLMPQNFEHSGKVLCRTIEAGPNEDIDKLVRILIGAVGAARERIAIMTPYFLPPRELELAVQTAALRGVKVDVIMPENNNLPVVKWAANHTMREMLKIGVNCYFQPGDFVHSKLFIVDDEYVQIGSANLDPRSLRLNFELMVEVYDQAFAKIMLQHFEQNLSLAKPIHYNKLQQRNLFPRLRDALSWMLSPYL